MKRSSAFAAAFLGGLLLTGCPVDTDKADNLSQPSPPPPRSNLDAIAERLREVEAGRVQDWASRDVDRIARHYAAGASVILPCQPRAIGAARIRARIERLLEDPGLQLRFDPDRITVAASGDLAYSVGTYTIRGIHPASGRRGFEIGNYLTAYRRQRDGAWQAVDEVAMPGGPPLA